MIKTYVVYIAQFRYQLAVLRFAHIKYIFHLNVRRIHHCASLFVRINIT